MRLGGQEHFYLETNATLACPGEDGAMEIFASTQNPTKTQNFCAYVCGLPANKVVCRMKRMVRFFLISNTQMLGSDLIQSSNRFKENHRAGRHGMQSCEGARREDGV